MIQNSTQWYIIKSGPHSTGELRKLAATGNVDLEDQIIVNPSTSPTLAKDIPTLFTKDIYRRD